MKDHTHTLLKRITVRLINTDLYLTCRLFHCCDATLHLKGQQTQYKSDIDSLAFKFLVGQWMSVVTVWLHKVTGTDYSASVMVSDCDEPTIRLGMPVLTVELNVDLGFFCGLLSVDMLLCVCSNTSSPRWRMTPFLHDNPGRTFRWRRNESSRFWGVNAPVCWCRAPSAVWLRCNCVCVCLNTVVHSYVFKQSVLSQVILFV